MLRGSIVKTATTDPSSHSPEIVDVAGAMFEYGSSSAHIVALTDRYEGLQERTRPAAIQTSTGIVNEILNRHRIDGDIVVSLIADVLALV